MTGPDVTARWAAPSAEDPPALQSVGVLLRYAVSVAAAEFLFGIVISRGLAPWSAAAMYLLAPAHALVFALPTALFLRVRGWRTFGPALIAGTVLGLVPVGLFGILRAGPVFAFEMAAMGAGCGVLAWAILRIQTTATGLLPSALRPAGGIVVSLAMIGLTVLATGLAYRLMYGPKDMSCHSLGRYGKSSFEVALTARLKMTQADWPRLRQVLAAGAAANGWSLRDYDRPNSLGGSLCQEVGTKITYRQWTWSEKPETEVTIGVVTPQGGEAWRPAVDQLFARLSAEWPGALAIEPPKPPFTPPVWDRTAAQRKP